MLRSGLDEFAERWIKFLRANELGPEMTGTFEESVNGARLAFEVLANLLEEKEYLKYQNVIRRLLHEWINSAATYEELVDIEEAFPDFILPFTDVEPESEEADEIFRELYDFFHSEVRAYVLSDYLQVYEEIIGAESRHTAYVLSHFEAILALTAHLNGANTRTDILDGLTDAVSGLFENVLGVAIYNEKDDGLNLSSVEVLDESIPATVVDPGLSARLEEIFNIGEPRWVSEKDLPSGLRNLIDIGTRSGISGCAIPIRPGEADGLLIVVMIGTDQPGTLELSLSRVASAECALALERASGRETINRVNRKINDILSLSREAGWGTSYHDTGEFVLEYLLDLVRGKQALILTLPPSGESSEPWYPLAWREMSRDEIQVYERASKLPSILRVAVRSGKMLMMDSVELNRVLRGKAPLTGFDLSNNEALGLLPLAGKGFRQGICVFKCPKYVMHEAETADVLAIFARTAADSLNASRKYELSLKFANLEEEDTRRARILQRQLTTSSLRTRNMLYWAHLQPAGELAGDVLIARKAGQTALNFWAADVAGRGTDAGWSMMYIRQLLAELPHDIANPSAALAEINRRIREIESQSSPGIYTGLAGLHLDEEKNIGRFARAGAPRMIKTDPKGEITVLDPEGLPLGLLDDAQLEDLQFEFHPGDKLIWASEGLLGLRDEKGKRYGESGLIDRVRKYHFLPARALYEEILIDVGEFSDVDRIQNDWSLVVIGYKAKASWSSGCDGKNRIDMITKAMDWLSDKCRNEDDLNALRLVLDEAITNAFEHGNRYNEDGIIELKLTCSKRHVHVQVRDEGGNLNDRVTEGHLPPDKLLEDKGRGFFLIRHQSDHLWVEDHRGELNVVRYLGGTDE